MSKTKKKHEVYLCPNCKELKTFDEFYHSKLGRITYCKECHKSYMRERYRREKAAIEVVCNEL